MPDVRPRNHKSKCELFYDFAGESRYFQYAVQYFDRIIFIGIDNKPQPVTTAGASIVVVYIVNSALLPTWSHTLVGVFTGLILGAGY